MPEQTLAPKIQVEDVMHPRKRTKALKVRG